VSPEGAVQDRYGWVMVAAGSLIMAVGFGMLISISVFLQPLEDAFGWKRGDTAFAYSSAAFSAGGTK
jgi:hypothetical protein